MLGLREKSTADNNYKIQLASSLISVETGRNNAGKMIETITTPSPVMITGVSEAFSETRAHIEKQSIGGASRLTIEGARNFGNIFNYATSKWAFACLIIAVILNRTNVYARTRWNLYLSWKVRLFLRITPILLLAVQCRQLLQSMHCQTSPEFAMLRWGNTSKYSDLMFSQNGGILHDISSIMLLKANNKDSCLAVGMIPSEYNQEMRKSTFEKERLSSEISGSLSLLWPLFKTIAFSQFVETISCAVLGHQQAGEFGMSFFELSLAFTEAEAVIMNKFNKKKFGSKHSALKWVNSTISQKNSNLSRSMILKNANTSSEVILIALISAMNHLVSHVLAIFNQQANFRLLNTGIWGLAYISTILSNILSFSLDDEPDQSLLRLPTVCIISFIPHALILLAIIGCSVIYAIALLLTAFSSPVLEEPEENQFNCRWPVLQRLILAHRNMQANVTLSRIHINLRMDFYTALLRIGFSIISMANEAVYLNESRGVIIKERTWLEEDRFQELEAAGLNWLGTDFRHRNLDPTLSNQLSNDTDLIATRSQSIDLLNKSSSGYSKEIISQTPGVGGHQRKLAGSTGIGTNRRSGRWYMAFEICLGFSRLLLGCYGNFHLWLMARLGIQSKPRWLLWMTHLPGSMSNKMKPESDRNSDSLALNFSSLDKELKLNKEKDIDIEAEFRKKALQDRQGWTDNDESELDATLYNWWLDGGWWGDKDNSGNFIPTKQEQDDDTTSLVSSLNVADDQTWESESTDENTDESIHRTLTQKSPLVSREATPCHDTTLSLTELAQLLDPKIPEQRAEAEALAAHLSNDHIVTRSRFMKIRQRSRARVLISTLQRPSNFIPFSPKENLTPEEESQILEHLIITRRSQSASNRQQQRLATWTGSMGESGPQCVVCQTSSRCIIVWPCRCLSLCNDCRITLAMNNFDKCVCCRRDVRGFSRIFVP